MEETMSLCGKGTERDPHTMVKRIIIHNRKDFYERTIIHHPLK